MHRALIEHFRATNQKKRNGIYIFDNHFDFRSFEIECRGHVEFFVKIDLSVMFISTPLS